MKFPEINFDYENIKITMNPTNVYWINSQTTSGNIVVIYNIIYNNGIETINAMIPYYLSNGHTNNFRANLLLPFYSFNLKTDTNCPQCDTCGEGLLFKINLVKNMNMKKFNKHLLDKLYRKIVVDTQDEATAISIINNMLSLSNNKIIGVLSVLRRMENFLDYVISINSEMLRNSNYNEINFRPVNIHTNENKYNMYNPDVLNSSSIKNPNFYPNGKKISKEDAMFRELLISSLRHHLNKFEELDMINVTMKEINIIESTEQEFNEWIYLCKDKNINFSKVENYENYKKISYIFGIFFKNKLENKISSGDLNEENLHFAEFYLRENFMEPTFITVNENITGWNAKCKKKYLKYKTKYLNLKKKNQM